MTVKHFRGAVFLSMLMVTSLAAMAVQPSTQLVSQNGGWILLGQLVFLVHILVAGRFRSCYRASYSLLYMMVLLVSWVLAFTILEISSSLLLGVLPLTLPVLYWTCAVSMGLQAPSEGEQDRLSCRRDNGCRS